MQRQLSRCKQWVGASEALGSAWKAASEGGLWVTMRSLHCRHWRCWCRCDLGVVWIDHPPPLANSTQLKWKGYTLFVMGVWMIWIANKWRWTCITSKQVQGLEMHPQLLSAVLNNFWQNWLKICLLSTKQCPEALLSAKQGPEAVLSKFWANFASKFA